MDRGLQRFVDRIRAEETPNKALDPTAVSVSLFMFTDFITFFSYLDRAVPAVGQLGRWPMETPPQQTDVVVRKPRGFDPGLRCLVAVFAFTVGVRVLLTLGNRTRIPELVMVALFGVLVGLVILIVVSAVSWFRHRDSERPPRRWAIIVAIIWASLQLLTYLVVIFRALISKA